MSHVIEISTGLRLWGTNSSTQSGQVSASLTSVATEWGPRRQTATAAVVLESDRCRFAVDRKPLSRDGTGQNLVRSLVPTMPGSERADKDALCLFHRVDFEPFGRVHVGAGDD